MYLLRYQGDDDFFCLVKFEPRDVPGYAIMSHTWGMNGEELNFQELKQANGLYSIHVDENGKNERRLLAGRSYEPSHREFVIERLKQRPGYKKILFCQEQAEKDGFKLFWVDSVCINRKSGAELSESINSIFRWYQNAERCYVYLSDITTGMCHHAKLEHKDWDQGLHLNFQGSRWFTRGWVRYLAFCVKSH